MSIENCPLSQIPTEIVAGGPSLVIQVKFELRLSRKIKQVLSLVFEATRPLQNNVKWLYENCDQTLQIWT